MTIRFLRPNIPCPLGYSLSGLKIRKAPFLKRDASHVFKALLLPSQPSEWSMHHIYPTIQSNGAERFGTPGDSPGLAVMSYLIYGEKMAFGF